MKNFTYMNPSSAEEAARFLMEPGAVAMGGGTDLLGVLKDGLLPEYPTQVVNLKHIPGLNGIEEQEDGLHIGAAATLREVADSPVVGSRWPALQDVDKRQLCTV